MQYDPSPIEIAPRGVAATPLEAAQRALDDALNAMDMAWVNLRGARERLQMLVEHEKWKALANQIVTK